MILGIITLLIAITISAVSAYYSILGLTAIFAAAATQVLIMGIALEAGKIMTAVWLHQNWKRAELQYKLYLVPAVIFLMLLTSLGVFGFLSKAHLDQAVPSGDIQAQVSIFDDKIKTQRDNIDFSRKALAQMDATVDQIIGRSTTEDGATRAANLRRSQQRERAALQNDITQSQKELTRLQEERTPIAAQARKVEAEVGPVKYVAALLYGDNPGQSLLEHAVRWVIILIVFVFDPLAIILILAGTKQIEWSLESREKKTFPKHEESVVPVVDDVVLTDEQIDNINALAELVKIDPPLPNTDLMEETVQVVTVVDESAIQELDQANNDLTELATFTSNQSVELINTKNSLSALSADYNDAVSLVQRSMEREVTLTQQLEKLQKERDLLFAAHSVEMTRADVLAIELGEKSEELPVQILEPLITLPTYQPRTDFGNAFPLEPTRGDMYLRIDFNPGRLFKWNDSSWIEIPRASTDAYLYNEEYMHFLSEEIILGAYSVDDLTPAEQQEVESILRKKEFS